MSQHEPDTTYLKQLGGTSTKWLAGNIAGLLAGGLIGWVISNHFAVESSKELKEEAAELRRINSIMLHGMEDAGWVDVSWDAEGQPIGVVIKLGGSGQAEAHGAATLNSFKPAP